MRNHSLLAVVVVFSFATVGQAQLRIADYNTGGGPRAGMATVLQGIGDEARQGFSKPLDILTLQEQTSSASTTQAILDLLNGIYGPGTYARATLDVGTSGGGRPGMIYNTNTVQLIDQVGVGTISSSGAARQTARYEVRPVGYDSSADMYIYASHYKADQGETARRNVEAAGIRANADALGPGVPIIYAGDFNIYTSSEPMWATLTAPGNGQAFDPINRVGNWHNNQSFMDVHTQSPVNVSRYGGQVTGGMDDRFDFQMTTSQLLDGNGLAIIPGSYHAFGNNGTHLWSGGSGELDVPSNTALPMAVLNAIAGNSDHLPVVADYQLPARMAASLGSAPAQLLMGASASVQLAVQNSAPVVTVLGADELNYTGSASGDLSASISGTALALAAANTHAVTLSTTTAGAHAGQVHLTATSQSAANASFSQNVNYSVLDHAQPSLASGAAVTSLDVDFGILALGSGPHSQALAIYNREATAGYTAGLDLDAKNLSGNVGAFSTDAAVFSGLAAGGSTPFSVSLDANSVGNLTASLALTTSDVNLPGALLLAPLHVALHGIVTWAGDANLDFRVDFADFQILQNDFGMTSGAIWQNGDFNGDGAVNFADFQLLQNDFGQSAGGNASLTAVPEPTSIALVLTSLASLVFIQRRRFVCRLTMRQMSASDR